MSKLLLFFCFALLSIVLCANGADVVGERSAGNWHQAWADYKQKFGKTYNNLEHEMGRMKVFLSNLALIEKHNEQYEQGKVTYKLGVNHLADLSPEEYMKLNGFRRDKNAVRAAGSPFVWSANNGSVPKSIDWRDHDYVTPVKNQGSCGSCWAFSATGALEGHHKRATGKLVSLSEQNLVDCSKQNEGCNGGLMDLAFDYIKENKGIDTERSYRYEGRDGKCRFRRRAVGATDNGYVDIPVKNETALKAAVGTLGPVSVAIDAGGFSFQFYQSGVFDKKNCFQELNHGVLVVGYGTDPKQGDYWIVKNSWGSGWGMEGYVLMARGKNMCGIGEMASYPLV